ncbi:protein sisterless A-like [Lucilia sericata]|uniref:protein sisterless A-like n=1 Tax=Lucilia sericata TaxID=13632 RepID=UPI0018A81DAF|nr:protein sisterless A-like [Lucilia sericata]
MNSSIMENSTENGYFLQQIYKSLSQDLQIQPFNPAALASAMNVNPENIDHMVEMELKVIKENVLKKEQQYVEQMLRENPIVIERRNNNNQQPQQQQQTSSDDDVVDVVTVSTSSKRENQKFLQQQRAEACRRSRYNNKIKKAKSKYRHKYISQKLLQSAQMFDCIQDLIKQAENQLLSQGLPEDKLQQLRQRYDMEYVQELNQTIKMEE